MSGEWLNDVCYGMSEYKLEELGKAIEPINPMLGQMLIDLTKPIHTVNYWQSGDCGQGEHAKAWKEFTDKWVGSELSVKNAKECIMKDVEEKVNTMLGIEEERDW